MVSLMPTQRCGFRPNRFSCTCKRDRSRRPTRAPGAEAAGLTADGLAPTRARKLAVPPTPANAGSLQVKQVEARSLVLRALEWLVSRSGIENAAKAVLGRRPASTA